MLNELDKELERRDLRFTRYADDCVIAVKSEASAKRVMHTVTDWIQRKLGLKVNMTKTHITRPQKLKYLGFGFYKDRQTGKWKCRPHDDSVAKFKRKLKELTSRSVPGKVTWKISKINQVIRGWINYYALSSMKTAMAEIDAHLRIRLRVIIWKQWKVLKKRQWGLQKLGIGKDRARQTHQMRRRIISEWFILSHRHAILKPYRKLEAHGKPQLLSFSGKCCRPALRHNQGRQTSIRGIPI